MALHPVGVAVLLLGGLAAAATAAVGFTVKTSCSAPSPAAASAPPMGSCESTNRAMMDRVAAHVRADRRAEAERLLRGRQSCASGS